MPEESIDLSNRWTPPQQAATRPAIHQYMSDGLGLSAPRITIHTKVVKLLPQEAANFVLRADLSLQYFQRTQVLCNSYIHELGHCVSGELHGRSIYPLRRDLERSTSPAKEAPTLTRVDQKALVGFGLTSPSVSIFP